MAWFANSIGEPLAQALTGIRERVDWLEHILEQEKSANAELIMEIDSYEETLRKVQGKVDYQDDEIRKVEEKDPRP